MRYFICNLLGFLAIEEGVKIYLIWLLVFLEICVVMKPMGLPGKQWLFFCEVLKNKCFNSTLLSTQSMRPVKFRNLLNTQRSCHSSLELFSQRFSFSILLVHFYWAILISSKWNVSQVLLLQSPFHMISHVLEFGCVTPVLLGSCNTVSYYNTKCYHSTLLGACEPNRSLRSSHSGSFRGLKSGASFTFNAPVCGTSRQMTSHMLQCGEKKALT